MSDTIKIRFADNVVLEVSKSILSKVKENFLVSAVDNPNMIKDNTINLDNIQILYFVPIYEYLKQLDTEEDDTDNFVKSITDMYSISFLGDILKVCDFLQIKPLFVSLRKKFPLLGTVFFDKVNGTKRTFINDYSKTNLELDIYGQMELRHIVTYNGNLSYDADDINIVSDINYQLLNITNYDGKLIMIDDTKFLVKAPTVKLEYICFNL